MSIGNGDLETSSAFEINVSKALSESRDNTKTWHLESNAAFNSNDGFSVVAPTNTTMPSSTTGKKASCWERLNRCISSTNKSVPRPNSLRLRASSKAFLRSATPEKTAERDTNSRSVSTASKRAIVVFPQPGGPQKIREASLPFFSILVRGAFSPNKSS